MIRPKYMEGQVLCVATNSSSTKVRVLQIVPQISTFSMDFFPMYKVETVEYGTSLIINEYDLRPLTADELQEYKLFLETKCECGGQHTKARDHFTWCPTYVIIKQMNEILPRGDKNE